MSDIFKTYGLVQPEKVKFVQKGWGFEQWCANGPLYCLKKLFVAKGRKCSYHYHEQKDETFLVVSGRLLMAYNTGLVPAMTQAEILADWDNAKRCHLKAGDVFHIPPLMRHQFYGNADSLVIETSTQHFDEDSIRLIEGDK
jgi:mannose-6-phosphate isomerase-like protein (cupin superfamily)